MVKFNNVRAVSAVAVHTHTCNFIKQWSKGGSKEHSDVVILPRDFE